MGKNKRDSIDTYYAIKFIENILKQVYPGIANDELVFYGYSDKCISHYLNHNDTSIGKYIIENFEEGLLQLVHFIETNKYEADELSIAQQLLSALTEYGYENDGEKLQDKKAIIFRLYVEEKTFREALLAYVNSFTLQYYQYLCLAQEGVEELNNLEPLIIKMKNGVYWNDMEKIPSIIEFEYIYPNGKSGDILKYIFDEYGENAEKSGLIWYGKIEKKYLDLFAVLYPISESYGKKAKVLSDDPKYTEIFEQHIPVILDNRLTELQYKRVNYFPKFADYQNYMIEYGKKQKQNRTEIYSQLILQGRTSPKWQSEAQLFALVSNLYPDAIYQYRADWLYRQSLDIFIPSLSVGIEYQGVQHYKPIEHFGGEEHFRKQQNNDRKKKELCAKNGVTLIEWPYTENISETTLLKYLKVANER